jgi:hypothetical protein
MNNRILNINIVRNFITTNAHALENNIGDVFRMGKVLTTGEITKVGMSSADSYHFIQTRYHKEVPMTGVNGKKRASSDWGHHIFISECELLGVTLTKPSSFLNSQHIPSNKPKKHSSSSSSSVSSFLSILPQPV